MIMLARDENALVGSPNGKRDGPIASWLRKRKSQRGLRVVANAGPIPRSTPTSLPTSPLPVKPDAQPPPPQSPRSVPQPLPAPRQHVSPPRGDQEPPRFSNGPYIPPPPPWDSRKVSVETVRSRSVRKTSGPEPTIQPLRHTKSDTPEATWPRYDRLPVETAKLPEPRPAVSNTAGAEPRILSDVHPALRSPEEGVNGGLNMPLAFNKIARDRGFSTSATRPAPHTQAAGSLRPSTSIPDYEPAGSFNPRNRPYTPSGSRNAFLRDSSSHDEVRASFRSALTTTSSYVGYSSGTERSSVVTKSSSTSDFRDAYLSGADKAGGMSVDEAIGMYERGFTDDAVETADEDGQRKSLRLAEAMNGSIGDSRSEAPVRAAPSPQREESGTNHSGSTLLNASPEMPTSEALPPTPASAPRDRYGFRKANQYVTLAQYDAWDAPYTESLARRKKKWTALLAESGLPTNRPERFPPASAKVKRFVRKGIPPEWRGAAWWWYAGGPARQSRQPELYADLVRRAEGGEMSENDQELIERDLHRTFPDNIKFKADVTAADAKAGGTPDEVETPTLQSLRRVLQAFSVHNPRIGYCQSLNFLVGLLLLFMEEERAFWMLDIITQLYLPGTHEVNLEGANVDLAVLMTSIKESMPAVWAKIGGELDGSSGADRASTRLPPITLCTTAWFMSCFICTLPIETVLRVWDSFFHEGSKTLFRVALAIFKVGEAEIRAVTDPMEIFQVVQTIPRRLVDASALMEACFKRRNGFGHLSQETIDERRRGWRGVYAKERALVAGGKDSDEAEAERDGLRKDLRRMNSRARLKRIHLVR
ncbi:MAG: hypothetical protein M1832_003407 [Thelocarpon impressellum]|nr:MAG: hypothetical protein M1832_003407 [Thelocarpon impressellum]